MRYIERYIGHLHIETPKLPAHRHHEQLHMNSKSKTAQKLAHPIILRHGGNDRFTKSRRARTLVTHQRTFIVGKVSGRGWSIELQATGYAVEPSDPGYLCQFLKFPDWPHYPPVTTLEVAN